MKWNKNRIELNKLPLLINSFQDSIKRGDPMLENIRCVFLMDNGLIGCLTPFDFIDAYNNNLKIQLLLNYVMEK